MKKIVTAAASLALVATTPMAAPTTASAQDAEESLAICRVLVELEVVPNVGACLGDIRSNAQQVCKDIEPYWEFFGVRNLGDCVSLFRGRMEEQ